MNGPRAVWASEGVVKGLECRIWLLGQRSRLSSSNKERRKCAPLHFVQFTVKRLMDPFLGIPEKGQREPNMGWSGCPKMVRRGRKISSVKQTYLKPWSNDTKNQTTLIQQPSEQTRQWNPNMGSIQAPAILWGFVWKHFVAGDHMYHKPINIQTEWLDKKEGAGFYKLASFCDLAFWVRWYPESRHYRPRVT